MPRERQVPGGDELRRMWFNGYQPSASNFIRPPSPVRVYNRFIILKLLTKDADTTVCELLTDPGVSKETNSSGG